jgi:hypothetical protein
MLQAQELANSELPKGSTGCGCRTMSRLAFPGARSSFEELEVPVACFWGEGGFGVDLRGDAATVASGRLCSSGVRFPVPQAAWHSTGARPAWRAGHAEVIAAFDQPRA